MRIIRSAIGWSALIAAVPLLLVGALLLVAWMRLTDRYIVIP